MYEDRPYRVLQTVCTCDRCGLEMRREAREFEEWEERVSLVFRAGYGSVFGDGSLVELDLCQHCVQDLLGRWVRVTPDDPCNPRHQPSHEARRAYQDHQLRHDLQSRSHMPTHLQDLFA